jgi:predicted DCC family thiol-disulfide oxidoreductase YuxK
VPRPDVMSPAMAEAIVEGGRRGHTALTVLYDERCPLCRKLRGWLGRQATTMPIRFVAAGSPEARRRFPALDHERTTTVLTVVSQDGAVYEGERAWLVCAWALPGWQPVAERLGTGIRLRLVRVLARAVDGYRHRLIAAASDPSCPGDCRVLAPAPVWSPAEWPPHRD